MKAERRERLEKWLQSVWYAPETPPWWLRALVPVYRIAFALDRMRGHRKQPAGLTGRCVIVVGNLTAGGTGKTPLVIRLCQILARAGYRPAVISRGYGRTGNRIMPVTARASAERAGDEPVVVARRTGAPVLVGRDRAAMAMMHFRNGADVVISDDGLQHHALPRAIELCVVDQTRGFGNGWLLPAGPLRERVDRLDTVDYVVVSGDTDVSPESGNADDPPRHRMTTAPGLLHSLDGEQTWRLAQFRGCKANAVAGIGNNERFFNLLERAGIVINTRSFPDHHPYTARDFEGLDPDLPILMTEKDAIKCMDFGLSNAWYLVIDAVLATPLESDILARVGQFLASPRHGKDRTESGHTEQGDTNRVDTNRGNGDSGRAPDPDPASSVAETSSAPRDEGTPGKPGA